MSMFYVHNSYTVGLYGTLILNGTDQQKEPFANEYDGELSMLLSYWYHESVYAQAAGIDGKDKHL
jgi:L-ascorbate oxidase